MTNVLRIPAYLLDAVAAHARSEHPREACGFLTGPRGGNPDSFVPIPNVHDEPTRFYAMRPDSVLDTYHRLDTIKYDVLVVYHSHTNAGSALSVTDVIKAADLKPVYLVCSTHRSTALPTFQAWRIVEDEEGREAVEVALDIVDAWHPESPLVGLVEGNRVRCTYDSGAGRRTVVAIVGQRSKSGDGVVLYPLRPGATGPRIVVALDRIRSVGILEEGTNAAAVRQRAASHLQEAVIRLGAQDTTGAREAIGRAGALMPRLIPPLPPVPRAYRPKRKSE